MTREFTNEIDLPKEAKSAWLSLEEYYLAANDWANLSAVLFNLARLSVEQKEWEEAETLLLRCCAIEKSKVSNNILPQMLEMSFAHCRFDSLLIVRH
jgi:hypothetical protein